MQLKRPEKGVIKKQVFLYLLNFAKKNLKIIELIEKLM